jgi:hypothetical protein
MSSNFAIKCLLLGGLFLSSCGREEIQTRCIPSPTPSISNTPLSSSLPAGWKVLPPSGIRVANYSIEGTDLELYLVPLSSGNVVHNANRWREQLGLPPQTAEEIKNEAQCFQLHDHEACWLEIENPESGLGIFATIIDHAPIYWYFTAKGSTKELRAHKKELQDFPKSLPLNNPSITP